MWKLLLSKIWGPVTSALFENLVAGSPPPPAKRGGAHYDVSRGKKCSFFGKSGVLCFLGTPVLRFAFLPYYQRKYLS